jgi:hypothetical protein
MKMKVEKMVVGVQDGRKLQDALAIKRQKTRWFSLPCDTIPDNDRKGYIERMRFLWHLLTAFS